MPQLPILLRRYLRGAWRRRWIGVAVAWLVCLAGWGGLHFIKDQYRVRARLHVDADAVLTPLLRGVAIDINATDQLSILQRTLLSRPNLQTLISKTDLGLGVSTPGQRERLIDRLSTEIKMQSQEKNLFSIEYTHSNPSDYPHFACIRSAPSIMSMRRDQPRHITALPGGGSRARAR